MKVPRKAVIDGRYRTITVYLVRSDIHRATPDGFDAFPWLISWIRRLARRQTGWAVEVYPQWMVARARSVSAYREIVQDWEEGLTRFSEIVSTVEDLIHQPDSDLSRSSNYASGSESV
jgi:hypothetical protein